MRIPTWLLVDVATLEAALVLATWLALLLSGLSRTIRRARAHRIAEARRALVGGLLSRSLTAEASQRLERLSNRERLETFLGVAPNLRGSERAWLESVADEMGLVRHGTRLCRSRFWWRRLRGLRILTLVGGREEDVLPLADDTHPLVRSQVVEWCGVHSSPAAIRTVVSMLADSSRVGRFAVQDALVRLGEPAVAPLVEQLGQIRDPIEAITGLDVARGLADPRLTEPALFHSWHPDPAVRRRAYYALGATRGAEAADRLEEGLNDPDESARAAAAESLGAMGHWPAAGALSRLLSSPIFDLRHAAAVALARLGAPGELFLRRALGSADRYAADMARHMLETAAVVTGIGRPS